MTPSEVLTSYRSMISQVGQPIGIRRYSGTGPSRQYVDTSAMAYVRNYTSKELIGAIAQGDQVAITLIDALGAILPVRTTDFLVVGTAQFSIKNVMKRVVGGVLIAVEIHATGGL